jgi:hypothetical protein
MEGGRPGVDVVNHSNFPSSVVSVSEPSDVTTSGGGRSMSEEVMIGLEGGGEDDSRFGSANRPRGFYWSFRFINVAARIRQ